MPLAGKGMLITSMDVDPADEQDFNLWYDREHLAERVGIEGFLEARRWIAEEAPTKYFCTYSTDRFEALSSPAYKTVLANQTDWSKKHISRFRNFGRVVGCVSVSRGQGRGAVLGVVRLRPGAASKDALRTRLSLLLDPGMLRHHLAAPCRERPGAVEEPQQARRAEPRRRRLVRADRWQRTRSGSAGHEGPLHGVRRGGRLDRPLPADVGSRQERPLMCPSTRSPLAIAARNNDVT